ncbi:Hsp20/alpha crystallin family protein [Limibacter armeniacum]|uniref:Hsp20/alpha crystallin family protein n=1 Tax=Limibacter armeniacum TaxID=466084 RepID=UPI002FE5BEE4
MSLIKKEPGMLPTFGRMFEDLFNKDLFDLSENFFTGNKMPAVNVKETERAYELEVAAPGINKDDFKIEVNDNVLTISSEVKSEVNEEDKGQFRRREFSYQSFKRSFTLPQDHVDLENIKASHNNGVLMLNIPKKDPNVPKTVRSIEIS